MHSTLQQPMQSPLRQKYNDASSKSPLRNFQTQGLGGFGERLPTDGAYRASPHFPTLDSNNKWRLSFNLVHKVNSGYGQERPLQNSQMNFYDTMGSSRLKDILLSPTSQQTLRSAREEYQPSNQNIIQRVDSQLLSSRLRELSNEKFGGHQS